MTQRWLHLRCHADIVASKLRVSRLQCLAGDNRCVARRVMHEYFLMIFRHDFQQCLKDKYLLIPPLSLSLVWTIYALAALLILTVIAMVAKLLLHVTVKYVCDRRKVFLFSIKY